jgi:hypothetical protein
VKPRTNIRDERYGQMEAALITGVTAEIPCDCMCSWSVIKAGPGRAAVSQLRFRNSLCSARHPEPAPAAAAAGTVLNFGLTRR